MLHRFRNLQLSETERDAMRAEGRFNAELMDVLRPHVKAGVTTDQIDKLAHEYTLDHGHVPACLGYHDFPKSCCTSINEVICHGIPGSYELRIGWYDEDTGMRLTPDSGELQLSPDGAALLTVIER